MTGPMRCSRCSADLQQADGDGSLTLFACLACGGVWLDTKTSNEVKSAFSAWAVRVADVAATSARVPIDTHSYRRLACPICQAAMRKAYVPGARLEIDVCEAHGTFYDKGELSAVLRVVKKTPAKRLYAPVAVAAGAGAVAAGAVALAASGSGSQHLQAASYGGTEMVVEVAEVAVDMVDVVDVVEAGGAIAEAGGAIVEGGASILGFLGELLGGLSS